MGEVGVFSKKEDLDKNCFVPMTIGNMKKSEDDVLKFYYYYSLKYFVKTKEALFFIHPEKASVMEQKIYQINNLVWVKKKNNIFFFLFKK